MSNNFQGTGRDQLRGLVERIERLEDEKRAIGEDIRQVKAEAKDAGFDVKIINELIKLRMIDPSDRAEREALLDTYMAAIGMLPETTGDEK